VNQRGIDASSLEVQGLEPGSYYWRVSAQGEGQLEGAFSPPAQFTVTKPERVAAPPPPIQIETLDVRMNILQIKGRTVPGSSVTVNGQPVEVDRDGSFAEFITLQQTGRQEVVIRATTPDGGVSEERRAVVVAN
jgi:hypothetical protein